MTAAACLAVWMALCPDVSHGQDRAVLTGREGSVALIAQLASVAHVAFRTYPAGQPLLDTGQTGDLVVIAGEWLLARGDSLSARCTLVPPPDEQDEELVSLGPDAASPIRTSFLQRPNPNTIPLITAFNAGAGQQTDVHAMLVVRGSAPTSVSVLRITVVAF
jgi:hypothetical protein